MTGEFKINWSSVVLVAGLSAAIGFGAVYATVGGGDNKTDGGALSNQALQSEPADNSSRLQRTASQVANSGRAKSVLLGPKGEKLNRGKMATFVFKNQPMALSIAKTFNGADGLPKTLMDFKGRVVLLNLWATWCAPCRKEMPYLAKLQQELGGDQFQVVAISVDRGSPEGSKKFLADVGATALDFYHDPSAQFGFVLMAIGMPTTLLIDRQGREIGRMVGPAEWHSEDAKKLIRAAIAAG